MGKNIELQGNSWRHIADMAYSREEFISFRDDKAATNLPFRWYMNYRTANSKLDYLEKIAAYRQMKKHVTSKQKELQNLHLSLSFNDVMAFLDKRINALEARAGLYEMRFSRRLQTIAIMYINGQYKYFYGWKSLLKDLMIS